MQFGGCPKATRLSLYILCRVTLCKMPLGKHGSGIVGRKIGPAVITRQQQPPCGGMSGSETSSSSSTSGYMDVNGTYLCTAYNPRCFLLQKVSFASCWWSGGARTFPYVWDSCDFGWVQIQIDWFEKVVLNLCWPRNDDCHAIVWAENYRWPSATQIFFYLALLLSSDCGYLYICVPIYVM